MNAIFLVRHLPTAWNREGVLQGRRDLSILAVPEESRTRLRQALPAGSFDRVLCSPLVRTRESAACFGYPDAQVEELLREIDFGIYEGRPKAELMASETGWVGDPFRSVLAEQAHALRARVEEFFGVYRGRGRILAFAHGAWMRCAHALYHLGDAAQMNRFTLENGETLRFDAN